MEMPELGFRLVFLTVLLLVGGVRGYYQRKLIGPPMYAMALPFFSGAILLGADRVLLGLSLVATAIVVFRVPQEDRMMLDAFGDEYLAYKAKTGALFPRLSSR